MSPDRFIIDKIAEPAAGWVMDRWGVSHFAIAAELSGFSLVCLAGSALAQAAENPSKMFIALPLFLILAALVYFALHRDSRRRSESYDPDARTLNELTVRERGGRYVYAISTAFCVAIDLAADDFATSDALFAVYYSSVFATVYFRACQGRPPRARQRELKLSLQGGSA